jgi:hypothetical protein
MREVGVWAVFDALSQPFRPLGSIKIPLNNRLYRGRVPDRVFTDTNGQNPFLSVNP